MTRYLILIASLLVLGGCQDSRPSPVVGPPPLPIPQLDPQEQHDLVFHTYTFPPELIGKYNDVAVGLFQQGVAYPHIFFGYRAGSDNGTQRVLKSISFATHLRDNGRSMAISLDLNDGSGPISTVVEIPETLRPLARSDDHPANTMVTGNRIVITAWGPDGTVTQRYDEKVNAGMLYLDLTSSPP